MDSKYISQGTASGLKRGKFAVETALEQFNLKLSNKLTKCEKFYILINSSNNNSASLDEISEILDLIASKFPFEVMTKTIWGYKESIVSVDSISVHIVSLSSSHKLNDLLKIYDFYILNDKNCQINAQVNDLFTPNQIDQIISAKIQQKETVNENLILSNEAKIAISNLNDNLFKDILKNPKVMHSLTSRQFEELIAEMFLRDGYSVQLTKATVDGGKDIFVAKKTSIGQFLYLVECKKYNPEKELKVGVNAVRSLYGIIMQEKATAGIIITTSYFTKQAVQFQEPIKHQLLLNDYDKLVKWLKQINQNNFPTRPFVTSV